MAGARRWRFGCSFPAFPTSLAATAIPPAEGADAAERRGEIPGGFQAARRRHAEQARGLYPAQCETVVHFVGKTTGSAPTPISACGRCGRAIPISQTKLPPLAAAMEAGAAISYTQWEAWLALLYGKDLADRVRVRGALSGRPDAHAEIRAARTFFLRTGRASRAAAGDRPLSLQPDSPQSTISSRRSSSRR